MDFVESKIVPDLLDKAPDDILKVAFGAVEVSLGNALTKEETSETPAVTYTADSASLYTVMMADPDAVSGTVLHWLVVNVPGDKLSLGEIKATYRGPGPPPGSGIHRYVFLVYKQSSTLNNVQDYETQRRFFDFRGFITSNNLGNPSHGNYFTVNAN